MEVSGQNLRLVSITPQETTPVPTEQKVGWTVLENSKASCPYPDRPFCKTHPRHAEVLRSSTPRNLVQTVHITPDTRRYVIRLLCSVHCPVKLET